MENHTGPIPPWLNRSYIENILSNSLKLPDLNIKTMDITPGSNVGDNYSCQIFRIRTAYTSNGSENTLSLIAKYTKPTILMDFIGGGEQFFTVEAAFYTSLSPKIQEITGSDQSIGPKIYHIDYEKLIIFMEDISVRDFKLEPRENLLNLDQCYLTIDALATFHGASYYLLQENPNLKQTFKKYFWSSEKNAATDGWFSNTEKAIRSYLPKYGLSETHQQKLLSFFETLKKDNLKVCDLQTHKLNFLLHGDCWKSNLMFHFNGKTADAIKLLDFQIVNYNCFANDLQHFLFSSVDAKILVDNLDDILKRYYGKLVEVAPDIPGVTFERIKKEFEERYFFGFVLAIIFRGVFFADKVPEVDDAVNGVPNDSGYADSRFISSLKIFLEFFEKVGVI